MSPQEARHNKECRELSLDESVVPGRSRRLVWQKGLGGIRAFWGYNEEAALPFSSFFLFVFFPMLETSATATGTYSGCATPPSSFVKAFTATPTNFNSILNTAAAGDVIYLNSGNYGAVSISGTKYAQFLSIRAGSGQTPVLSSLVVNSVSHMVFAGLTINGNGARSKSPGGILVNLASSNNIVFENNIVRSTSSALSHGGRKQRMRRPSTPPLRPATASMPLKTIASL